MSFIIEIVLDSPFQDMTKKNQTDWNKGHILHCPLTILCFHHFPDIQKRQSCASANFISTLFFSCAITLLHKSHFSCFSVELHNCNLYLFYCLAHAVIILRAKSHQAIKYFTEVIEAAFFPNLCYLSFKSTDKIDRRQLWKSLAASPVCSGTDPYC